MIHSALIAGAGSVAGGLIDAKAKRSQWKKSKAFASTSIQRRVADAKKAGVHPLYALGAPSYSPAISMGSSGVGRGVSEAASQVARGISSRLTAEERMGIKLDLEGKRIANRKDEAITMYYVSEAARNEQAAGSMVAMPPSVVGTRGSGGKGGIPGTNYPVDYSKDIVEYGAAGQPSRRSETPYVAASQSPGFEVHDIPGHGEIVVPSTGGQGLGETFENLGFIGKLWGMYLTAQANLAYRKEKRERSGKKGFWSRESGREAYKKKLKRR